ncbi:MAG: tetratricopeptide repeat protein [Chloroflexi bacterium]|nr:tetratricopeptide repeat protein [Chloroflexota bacterium]
MNETTWQPEEDQAFVNGVRSLQRGDFQTAITLFSDLSSKHPENEEVRTLLQEAQMKMSLIRFDARRVIASDIPRFLRKLIVLLAAVDVILYLTVAMTTFYQRNVVPQSLIVQAASEQRDLLSQAERYMASGDYTNAIQTFETLLQKYPGHTAAQEGLAAAEKAQKLQSLYTQALQEQEEGRLREALTHLQEIATIQSFYRDVEQRITVIQQQLVLQALMEQAQGAYEAAEWATLATICQEIRQVNPEHEKTKVNDWLFASYLGQGQGKIAIAGTDISLVEEALDFFEKALVLRPLHPEASTERYLAQAYLAALKSLSEGQNERAAQFLERVIGQRTDYAGGWARRLYLESCIKASEDYIGTENYELAVSLLRKALSIVSGSEEVQNWEEFQEQVALGDELVAEGSLSEAVAAYQAAVDQIRIVGTMEHASDNGDFGLAGR